MYCIAEPLTYRHTTVTVVIIPFSPVLIYEKSVFLTIVYVLWRDSETAHFHVHLTFHIASARGNVKQTQRVIIPTVVENFQDNTAFPP